VSFPVSLLGNEVWSSHLKQRQYLNCIKKKTKLIWLPGALFCYRSARFEDRGLFREENKKSASRVQLDQNKAEKPLTWWNRFFRILNRIGITLRREPLWFTVLYRKLCFEGIFAFKLPVTVRTKVPSWWVVCPLCFGPRDHVTLISCFVLLAKVLHYKYNKRGWKCNHSNSMWH